MKTIHSPEGVSLLMENLWLRHKAGMKQRPSNVYMVECLPQRRKNWLRPAARQKRTVAPMMTPKNYTEHGFDRHDI